jgi:hypothetical protein
MRSPEPAPSSWSGPPIPRGAPVECDWFALPKPTLERGRHPSNLRLAVSDLQWDKKGVQVARTHVVMADDVLEAVDQLVGQRGRSRFLEEAAREKLTRVGLEAALRATAGVIRTAHHPEWQDRAATAAWVSELREHGSA